METVKKTTTIKEALRREGALVVETPTPVAPDQHAVEEGRKPLASRRGDVAALKAKALELYGLPPGGLGSIPGIESAFKFSSLDSDRDFNYLRAEPLLDQAAFLLDRCNTARSQRDRLQIEKWKLQLELDQFFRLDQVQEREREASLDTLPYERAVIESGAERSLGENHRNAEAQLKGFMDDLLSTGLNKRMAARELEAWISAYPNKDIELSGDDAFYVFDGERRNRPDHLYEAAHVQADEDGWEQIYSLMFKRFTAQAASESGRLRKESLDLLAKWSLANIGFRRERAQAERDAVWEKVYQVQSPGGVLNYNERIDAEERRFASNFREALARLAAARRGLSELYDYAPPFPQEGTADFFDEVLRWVASAQTRLGQLSQLDQHYVLALSVKELAKGEWKSGLGKSEWTFEVSEELFPGQALVRLRGLGMAVALPNPQEGKLVKVVRSKPQGVWSAQVSIPPTGALRPVTGAPRELDQQAVPVCFLGRVADRASARPPEVAGIDVLHNASPIGKPWKVKLSPKSTGGAPSKVIEDVELYLHLAVRGQKA